MATPTYSQIANLTLGSAQSTITVTGLSQSYRDLVVILSGTYVTAGYPWMRINNDATSTYWGQWFGQAGGSGGHSQGFTSGAATTEMKISFQAGSTNSLPSQYQINILDYSATDRQKSSVTKAVAYQSNDVCGARWASSSAVTQLNFGVYSSGQFAAGTTITIYGIAA
jgi:hypothetical protein